GSFVFGRRVLPLPARRCQGRRRPSARTTRVAVRESSFRRRRRAAAPACARAIDRTSTADAHPALAAPLALLLPRDVADLPAADSRGACVDNRTVAAVRSMAAHLGAPRVCRSLRRRRPHLRRSRTLVRRL